MFSRTDPWERNLQAAHALISAISRTDCGVASEFNNIKKVSRACRSPPTAVRMSNGRNLLMHPNHEALMQFTLLAALPRGLLLLHPGVLRHVDAGRVHAVGHLHGVAAPGRRVLGAHGGHLAPGHVGQRRHELRHRGLAVNEAGLAASLEGVQPEAAFGGRGPRLHHHVVRRLLQVSRRHPVLDSHRLITTNQHRNPPLSCHRQGVRVARGSLHGTLRGARNRKRLLRVCS